MATRYRKKPVVIEAIQWTGDLTASVINFLTCPFRADLYDENASGSLFIPTLEGEMEASVGDWIIRGVAGEFYPCRDDIFRMTYEKADD